MNPRVFSLLKRCTMRPGAGPPELDRIQRAIGMRLPDDYLELVQESDGVEGFVGDNYLAIWPVEHILTYRKLCDDTPFIVFFGSNGAGEGYAFDMRAVPAPIVNLPFIGMEEKLIRVLGRSILEFLERLESAPLFP